MLSQIAKASLRSEVLIDFDCYMDTELGLIRLIKNKYFDKSVFNEDKLNQDTRSIILSLIDRKEINPLYLFANDNISKDDLDDYYFQFMTEEYGNILKYSVTTEIKSLINLFSTENGIHITILCNDEREKIILENDETLNDCKIILFNDNIDFSKYTVYYFKYITDRIFDFIFPYKTYYFSKYMINFNDEKDFIRKDIIDKIIYNKSEVEILDLYNKSYLQGV
jgi:hypothetical protein